MSKRVGRYSDKIREQAAIEYALCGNISKVAKDLNIVRKTVQSWKGQEWWDTLVTKVQQEKAEQHRAKYAQIVELAQDHVIATLPSATAAQANIIAATATDKVRLLDNMPTSISGKASSTDDLAAQFRALAASHQLVPRSKVIDSKPLQDADKDK